MPEEITIVNIINAPLKRLKLLLLCILIVGVVSLYIGAGRGKESEAVCNIKYIIITDSTGTPIGTPQYRLNNFLNIADKTHLDQFVMRLYQDHMTLVLKGKSANEIIDWANKNMPLFFDLEFNAYQFHIRNYNNNNGTVISFDTGISENTNRILEKMECVERNNKLSSKSIIILFIFLSFFSALAIYVFEVYVTRYLTHFNVKRAQKRKLLK